jgi:hypothetical protein
VANNIAFQPMGKTYKVLAPTANTAVVVTVVSDSPVQQYHVANPSTTDTVFVRISGTSQNAALPTNTGAYGVALPPTTERVLTQYQSAPSSNVYVSVIGAEANAIVYVTPGEGV